MYKTWINKYGVVLRAGASLSEIFREGLYHGRFDEGEFSASEFCKAGFSAGEFSAGEFS